MYSVRDVLTAVTGTAALTLMLDLSFMRLGNI